MMRPIALSMAGLAVTCHIPAALARAAQPKVQHLPARQMLPARDNADAPMPYSPEFPIMGVVRRNGAYYLDIDMTVLERRGFETYATAGGSQAGFARLSAGLVTTVPLSGALFDGWTLIGMTGYGRHTDTTALRNLESGNQWVGGFGLGYRF